MMKKGVRYIALVAVFGLLGVCMPQEVLANTKAFTEKQVQATDFHVNIGVDKELTEQEVAEVLKAQFTKDYVAFSYEFYRELYNGFTAEAKKAKEEYERIKDNPSISEIEKTEKCWAYEFATDASVGAGEAFAYFPFGIKDAVDEAQAVLDKYGVTTTDDDSDVALSPEQEKLVLTHLKAFLLEEKERNDKYRAIKEAKDAKLLAEYEEALKKLSMPGQDISSVLRPYGYSLGNGYVLDVTPLLEEVDKRIAELEATKTSTSSTSSTSQSTYQSSSTITSQSSSTMTNQSSSTTAGSSMLQDKRVSGSLSTTTSSEMNPAVKTEPRAKKVLPRTGEEKTTALTMYGVMSFILSGLVLFTKKKRVL